MRHLLLVCVASLALAGTVAAAGMQLTQRASMQGRRLLAQGDINAAQSVPQCEWNAESSSCEPRDAVDIMYAVRSKPISPYLWFLLMTHDRKSACDSQTSRNSCNADKANNCVWLDDILGATTAGTGRTTQRSTSKTTAAERTHTSLVATSPNLFMTQVAALKQGMDGNLRDLLGRTSSPILAPNMERVAAPAPAAGGSSTERKSTPKPSQGSSASGTASSSKKHLKCANRELIENLVFTKTGYSSILQAPVAMHCPGSKAHDLVRCMSQTSNAACARTQECVVVPRKGSQGAVDLCVSKHFHSLNKAQMNKFMFDLTLAEPSVVGSCDGACWMRQALLCNHTVGANSCNQLSFCRLMGASCVPKLYSQDHFGSTVQEYLGECMEVDNKQDCEAYRLRPVNKGRYARWSMPSQAAARCTVPSVGGMLSRKVSAATEGAARVEMLTMMGAETEKQAAALAAATAAAGATKAARIMSERGATGLQQLYSSVSTVLG